MNVQSDIKIKPTEGAYNPKGYSFLNVIPKERTYDPLVCELKEKFDSLSNRQEILDFLDKLEQSAKEKIVNRDLIFLTQFIRENPFNEKNFIDNKTSIKKYFFEINSIGKMDFCKLKFLLGNSTNEVADFSKKLLNVFESVAILGGDAFEKPEWQRTQQLEFNFTYIQ